MDRGRGRRAQVIGQKVEVPANWRPPVFPKTAEDLEFLQQVCMSDSLFKSLNQSDVEVIMRAFQPVKFDVGSTIIKQGDPGDKLYVIQSGECDITVNGKTVMKAKRGVKFGELALLHNAPRAATVTAEATVNTFSLDGTTFKAIMMGKAQQDTKDYLGFIGEVRILQSLPKADQLRLVDALQEREYAEGARIIKEGDEGDYFYIIRDGEVKCTQEATGEFEVSKRLRKGEYFGELSLLSAQRRAATVIATKKTQVQTVRNLTHCLRVRVPTWRVVGCRCFLWSGQPSSDCSARSRSICRWHALPIVWHRTHFDHVACDHTRRRAPKRLTASRSHELCRRGGEGDLVGRVFSGVFPSNHRWAGTELAMPGA